MWISRASSAWSTTSPSRSTRPASSSSSNPWRPRSGRGSEAMPRVLLIDPDRNALGVLQAALGQAGFKEIAAVTSGSFALTMLERNRPDLIVSRVGVPDIDGYELCSIVRKDPSMKGVLFLLLASPGDDAPPATLEEKPDQMLAGDLPIAAIVSERGRVVHAEFFGLIGETAFAALVVAADGDAHGSFVFNPLETGPDKAGRTINRDLRQLLLSAESGFDDGRADAAVAPRS